MIETDPRYHVETAARTVKLLKSIADVNGPVPLSAMVERLGWSKPAVYRLVRTLEATGALRQQDGKGYVLGPALISLGQSALRATRLPEIVRPYLEQLYQQIGETVVLTVLDGDEVVYVDRIEADKVIIPRNHLGGRLPAYCTSTGQVLLSGLTDEDVRRRLADREFVAVGPKTLASVDALIERLGKVRRLGYAINDEELAVGHRAAAVPLRDHTDGVAAAVSVSVAAARVSRNDLVRISTELLVPTAATISAKLGANVLDVTVG
ncbi:MAG: IclR family transcriptional regulator [Solirubrobacterales bacterium]|nr:IclR family transcriptional regulator [Solirubrobacterales bacterium]